jgi:hypothetical protein
MVRRGDRCGGIGMDDAVASRLVVCCCTGAATDDWRRSRCVEIVDTLSSSTLSLSLSQYSCIVRAEYLVCRYSIRRGPLANSHST